MLQRQHGARCAAELLERILSRAVLCAVQARGGDGAACGAHTTVTIISSNLWLVQRVWHSAGLVWMASV